MARGRHLSLEEARKSGKLDRFAKEQEIEQETPDPRSRFDELLEAMAKNKPKKEQQK